MDHSGGDSYYHNNSGEWTGGGDDGPGGDGPGDDGPGDDGHGGDGHGGDGPGDDGHGGDGHGGNSNNNNNGDGDGMFDHGDGWSMPSSSLSSIGSSMRDHDGLLIVWSAFCVWSSCKVMIHALLHGYDERLLLCHVGYCGGGMDAHTE